MSESQGQEVKQTLIPQEMNKGGASEKAPAVRRRPGRSQVKEIPVYRVSQNQETSKSDSKTSEKNQSSTETKTKVTRRGRKPKKQSDNKDTSSNTTEDASTKEQAQKDAEDDKSAEKTTSDASKSNNTVSVQQESEDLEKPKVRRRRSSKNTPENSNSENQQETTSESKSTNSRNKKSTNQTRQTRTSRTNTNARDNSHRRPRRAHQSNQEIVPSLSREDLTALKVVELREKAAELEINTKGLKKAELVEAIFKENMRAEGFIEVEGILDILSDGYGFLRTQGYLPSETDVYVSLPNIRRHHLRKGDKILAQTRPPRENEKYGAVQTVIKVNDIPYEKLGHRVRFADLTPIFPNERLWMEHGKQGITARVIDIAAPIGKGQRGLIVSPPKAGKTTILKDIAASITANNPEVHLMCLLIDERPEEVTDMERSIKGEVISSTFDMPCENHIAVSEMIIERAKRMVECGEDVVILLDSLTRLARAYNLAQPASGRILSGGVDSTALYPPKRFLGAARNIEHGGSLTILASALIETGSKMDDVIFEEFKGTGNMELKLDRSLADRRIFPAIDPIQSGTRREDLLLDPQEAPLIWAVRRILANMNSTERAMDTLIKSLKKTDNNMEFLQRTAKKAQNQNKKRRHDDELGL